MDQECGDKALTILALTDHALLAVLRQVYWHAILAPSVHPAWLFCMIRVHSDRQTASSEWLWGEGRKKGS